MKNNSQSVPLGRSCLSTVFNVICLSHFLLSAYAQNDDFRRTTSSLPLMADHLHLTCLPRLPVKNQSIILIICANVLISYQVPPPLASPASSVFKISFSTWEWYRPAANIYYSHLITSGVATCAKKLTMNILKSPLHALKFTLTFSVWFDHTRATPGVRTVRCIHACAFISSDVVLWGFVRLHAFKQTETHTYRIYFFFTLVLWDLLVKDNWCISALVCPGGNADHFYFSSSVISKLVFVNTMVMNDWNEPVLGL